MNWCILIPLLTGLISALLAYLLGRQRSSDNTTEDNSEKWKLKVANLEAELETCKKSRESLQANLGIASALLPFDADKAKAVFGKKIKQDDLTLVEGIGPKIQELFHNHGVKTWKELSECSVEKCQEVLNSGGDRYKIHIPDTWPEQARLAYEGLWQKLFDWQEKLDGGKIV